MGRLRPGTGLDKAGYLLRHADRYLTAAIENVYLYGLHLDSSTDALPRAHQLMPQSLYQTYCHSHLLP